MDISNNSFTQSSQKKLLDIFFEKKDLKCALCGRRLTPSTSVIDRKLPRALGGSNDISNLRLVCLQCNAQSADHPLLGYQFESYIRQIISAHPSYDLVDDISSIGQWKSLPDIVLIDRQNKVHDLVIAEVKLATSYTEDRIRNVISQLLAHREVKPDARLAFITPRELPEMYQELFKDKGIELWDKAYLSQEFGSQIEAQTTSQFTALFCIESSKNECDMLIQELKNCPTGKESWGRYEKLVK